MKRILKLSQNELLSGLATSEDSQDTGLWKTAQGLNPFIDNVRKGNIAVSGTPTDIGDGIIDSTLASYVVDIDGTNDYIYMADKSGGFYTYNIATETLTQVRNTTTQTLGTPSGGGMFIYQARGGTKYLYICTEDDIVRWDMTTKTTYNAGEWDDTWGTVTAGLTINDTPHHPTHKMFDEVYIGNLTSVIQFKDNGAGGVSVVNNALDFAGSEVCTSIADDGFYLALALTENLADSPIRMARSRVVFWNKTTSSWQQEHPIDDAYISSIIRSGNQVYVGSANALFVGSFSEGFKRIRTLDNESRVLQEYPQAMQVWGNGIIFGNNLMTYGEVVPGAKRAFHTPFTGFGSSVTMVIVDAVRGKVFVGTGGPALYVFDNTVASYSDDVHKTIFIDLGSKYAISQYRAVFGSMESGAFLGITLGSESTSITFPNVYDTDLKDGNSFLNISDEGYLETDHVQIHFTLSTASQELRDFELWGEELDE